MKLSKSVTASAGAINAVRRALVSETRVYRVGGLVVTKNTQQGLIYETLAHRLAQLPVYWTVGERGPADDVELKLAVSLGASSTARARVITTLDIVGGPEGLFGPDPITIWELNRGCELEATAKLVVVNESSCYAAYYSTVPDWDSVELKAARVAWVKSQQAAGSTRGPDELAAAWDGNSQLTPSYEDFPKPDEWVLTLETDGTVPAAKLLSATVLHLNERLSNFLETTATEPDVGSGPRAVRMTSKTEGATLGGALAQALARDPTVQFASSDWVHPHGADGPGLILRWAATDPQKALDEAAASVRRQWSALLDA